MKYGVALLLLLLLAAVGYVGAQYRQDLAQSHAQLAAGSQLAQTPCGPIEYAIAGQGPAVLLIHGSGGGYHQMAGLSKQLITAGVQTISMSRFGYLRTPMPAEASPPAQADAHVCLLDALGIPQAAALGASAGAPSAAQFCIRHADRCRALVLLVPALYAEGRSLAEATPPSPLMQLVIDHVLSSDLVIWALTRLRPQVLIETALATPISVFESSSAAEQQRALAMIRDIFPVSLKLQGLRSDTATCAQLPRYPLENIRAPTLAISVEDDLYGTHAAARYTAEQVPGARLLSYVSGGHVFLGHDQEIGREIAAFLHETAHAAATGTP